MLLMMPLRPIGMPLLQNCPFGCIFGGKKRCFRGDWVDIWSEVNVCSMKWAELVCTQPLLEVLKIMSSSICKCLFAGRQQHGGMRTRFSVTTPKNLLTIGALENTIAAYSKIG
jgi:hypothetical protein